ncbi:hypothetical protein AMS68_002103 [Peltaster fructicola]|uniref:NADP-dependent oxidoreductase domain-containing protein n=1 Tax=Peltaster fructicola TaxID=286661 RepID=A0A6H0XPH5_9PEZI|nr:hypothetical protein AMS68_002103 [Peltaster fructicola]
MASFMTPAPTPSTPLGLHKILSSTAGIHVSPLILGGMSLGNKWPFMGDLTKQQAFALLDAFYKAGGNFIDTANAYHDGQSEEWIGEWLQDKRDDIILATKYSFHYKAPTNEDKTPAKNNAWGNSKRSMITSLRDSLVKLNTDFVDIFYVHWWDFTCSIPEVMDALHLLVLQDKVLYLGISDTPAWVIAAANTYASDHGKTPFSIVQGKWNVADRDFERELLPMATHFGMAIAPWNVLGGGRFRTTESDSPRTADQTEEEAAISKKLSKIADAHSTTIQSICIAYLRGKSSLVIPLIGGRKVEHLEANIKALEVVLTAEEIAELEGEFDPGFPANFTGQDFHVTGKAGTMIKASGPLVL